MLCSCGIQWSDTHPGVSAELQVRHWIG